ncbi:PIN domain-like protein [Ramaria rubella]|nr:PIN domain-like protein [Ramaria rubella]
MGVPGLWKLLHSAAQSRSLTHIAVEDGFIANSNNLQAYCIGIDASIWFYQVNNKPCIKDTVLPMLLVRFSLLRSEVSGITHSRLLLMSLLPLFVFDGPEQPNWKRGKAVRKNKHWIIDNFKQILDAFGFDYRMARGETEAELAHLNASGDIDAVWSDDIDCFLFGTVTVMHSIPAASKRDIKERQIVEIYRCTDIAENEDIMLMQGGLILIALLCGGDYNTKGVSRCRLQTVHGLAKAGYGDTLLSAARTSSPADLQRFLFTWCEQLQNELYSNASGLLPHKCPTAAENIAVDFPQLDTLQNYTHPITSHKEAAAILDNLWQKHVDVGKIAWVCEVYFEWGVQDQIMKRFCTQVWLGVMLQLLLQKIRENSVCCHSNYSLL